MLHKINTMLWTGGPADINLPAGIGYPHHCNVKSPSTLRQAMFAKRLDASWDNVPKHKYDRTFVAKSDLDHLVLQVREGSLATTEGVSYLEAKNLLLLQYCMHLVFYVLLKVRSACCPGFIFLTELKPPPIRPGTLWGPFLYLER